MHPKQRNSLWCFEVPVVYFSSIWICCRFWNGLDKVVIDIGSVYVNLHFCKIRKNWVQSNKLWWRRNLTKVSKDITLFKTDSIREGCLACQNKNPRTTRWKISFTGLTINFVITVSSASSRFLLSAANCPAEFSSATPVTCSGNPTATVNAVNPPRLLKNSKTCFKCFLWIWQKKPFQSKAFRFTCSQPQQLALSLSLSWNQ